MKVGDIYEIGDLCNDPDDEITYIVLGKIVGPWKLGGFRVKVIFDSCTTGDSVMSEIFQFSQADSDKFKPCTELQKALHTD